VILVLKGHRTLVAEPLGKVYRNTTGNPGMATGGTGDVLTGMIAALIGQGFSLWDSARFGVYLHGLAGDLAAKRTGEASLTAGDLLDFLPRAIQKTRGI
jgi:NAD(P)H-hydrate epimerase